MATLTRAADRRRARGARRQLLPAVPPARAARPGPLRAYPRVEEFVAGKRRYDPGLLFQHAMWQQYFAT